MELHRRCSRSNIPALVMLLLQLSVLLSGAAAGAVAKSETQVDVKQSRAEEPVKLTLTDFTWDGQSLKICILKTEDDLVTDATVITSYQADLVTKVDGESVEFNIVGTIDDQEPKCASFGYDAVYPFADVKVKTYDMVIVDKIIPESHVNKAGGAKFKGPVKTTTSDGYKIICTTGATGTDIYRVINADQDNCIDGMVGFEASPDVCYTLLPDTGCEGIPDDTKPGITYTVCQPAVTYEDVDVKGTPLTSVSLTYNADATSKVFSFTSDATGFTETESIVKVDGADPIVYFGTTADSTDTGPPRITELYNLCVVGVKTISSDIVAVGIGSIQDTNLNLYDAGALLEFGFANKNPKDANNGEKVLYAIAAGVGEEVTLDCSAVPDTDVCFGFLDVAPESDGTLSVAFLPDNSNVISIPYDGTAV